MILKQGVVRHKIVKEKTAPPRDAPVLVSAMRDSCAKQAILAKSGPVKQSTDCLQAVAV